MDRLQFNKWYLDGWINYFSENFDIMGNYCLELSFQVCHGNLQNGDGRIWIVPDSNSSLLREERQGVITKFDYVEQSHSGIKKF